MALAETALENVRHPGDVNIFADVVILKLATPRERELFPAPVLGPEWNPAPLFRSVEAEFGLNFKPDETAPPLSPQRKMLMVAPDLGIVSLTGWILSLVVWQVHQTSPRRMRRIPRRFIA